MSESPQSPVSVRPECDIGGCRGGETWFSRDPVSTEPTRFGTTGSSTYMTVSNTSPYRPGSVNRGPSVQDYEFSFHPLVLFCSCAPRRILWSKFQNRSHDLWRIATSNLNSRAPRGAEHGGCRCPLWGAVRQHYSDSAMKLDIDREFSEERMPSRWVYLNSIRNLSRPVPRRSVHSPTGPSKPIGICFDPRPLTRRFGAERVASTGG